MQTSKTLSQWSVAIPVYNAISVTARTLNWLLSSGVEPERIRLLDDGSSDPNWISLRDKATSKGCRYDRYENNEGYTVNINRAFECDDKYILLLNSDCLIRKAEIEALIRTAEAYPMLAGLGPVSNSAGNQSVSVVARRSWVDLDDMEIGAAIDYLSPQLAWKFGQRPLVVPSVNGFCTLWRIEAMRDVGLFDDKNFARGYGEEDDICFRLMEAGWMCAVAPWLMAIHFKTQSFSFAERSSRKSSAMTTLREIYGDRFIQTVIDHFDSHPLMRQMAVEAVDT